MNGQKKSDQILKRRFLEHYAWELQNPGFLKQLFKAFQLSCSRRGEKEDTLAKNKHVLWHTNVLQVRRNRGEDKTKLTEGSLTPFRIVLSGLRKLQILTRWIKSWCLTSSQSRKMFIDKKERKREQEWVRNYSLTSERHLHPLLRCILTSAAICIPLRQPIIVARDVERQRLQKLKLSGNKNKIYQIKK